MINLINLNPLTSKKDYLVLPLLSAFLLGISRNPFFLHFTVFFAFTFLFFFLDKYSSSPKKIILAAFLFSLTYNSVTLYWISVVTVPGFIGLYIVQFVYFILIFSFSALLWNNYSSNLIRYSGFAGIWISFEYLKNFSEINFPWFNIAYSLSEYLTLIQLAEIGGVFILSILILVVNIQIKFLLAFMLKFDLHIKDNFKSLLSKHLIPIIIIMTCWFGYGIIRLNNLPLEKHDFKASIVQVSIPQYIKWEDHFFQETLRLYRTASNEASQNDATLVIWPESAIPEFVLYDSNSLNFIRNTAIENGVHLFTGYPHYKRVKKNDHQFIEYYNSANLFFPDGSYGRTYFKNILVPFGERLPFLDKFPFLWDLDFGQANWEYGKELFNYEIQIENTVYRFLPNICFEIAFPLFLSKVKNLSPDFIVNITNDAWFKRTTGPYQHAVMARFRAIETRTQVYRAANTGISKIIDPRGVVLEATELFEVRNISSPLFTYNKNTFFVRYFHKLPLIFLLLSIVLLSVICLKKILRWIKNFITQ